MNNGELWENSVPGVDPVRNSNIKMKIFFDLRLMQLTTFVRVARINVKDKVSCLITGQEANKSGLIKPPGTLLQ